MKNIKLNVFVLIAMFFVLFVFSGTAVFAQNNTKKNYDAAMKNFNAGYKKLYVMGDGFADSNKKAKELYGKAIVEFKKCILVNNEYTADAYNKLGYILSTGPNSLRNYEEAANYFYESLEILENDKKEISPTFYFNLGTALYRLGDYYSAFNNLKKAGELSNAYAGSEVVFYWLGLGVEQDLPKALELYRKAAFTYTNIFIWGYWDFIYALEYQINEYSKGNFHNEGFTLYLDYIHLRHMGEPMDERISKLKQSSDLGYAPAQNELYYIFKTWYNDYNSGIPYLKKAIEAGYVPAFFQMGDIYLRGRNKTKINYTEAARLLEKAAVGGHPIAQYNLGFLYFDNNIMAENGFSNKEMANYWLNASAEQGYTFAVSSLKIVESYRAPPSKFETAMMIFQTMANIANTSVNTYNSLNKSDVQSNSYVPPSSRPTDQNNSSVSNSSTSGSSRGQPCPRGCSQGKCPYSYTFGLSSCNGTGRIDCSVCRGTGILDKTGGKAVCTNCKGKQKVQCGLCHGDGKCRRCNGTGRI